MRNILISIILFVIVSSISGQNNNSKTSDFIFSFLERIRIEMWENTTDLNNLGTANTSYTRFKSSFGFQWNVSNDLIFNTKITNEFRRYISPKNNRFHWNEIFFDNLYLKVDNILPGTLTIGRQDISLGEGFLVKDGTPADGSRSVYFNAVKFDLKFDKANSLTLLALYQPFEDKYLPVLNGLDIESSSQAPNTFRVVEQTESGAGAYYSGDFNKTNLQGYYFWKYINFDEKRIVPESEIHTIGGRIKTSVTDMFTFVTEAAFQFGTYGNYDRSAYGGYAYLDYNTNFQLSILPRIVTVGAILLSGDDVTTANNEGWDPLFSRFPKWSESYIYTYGKEYGRNAYWSNLLDIYVKLEFNLLKDIDLILQNHYLNAPEKSVKTSLLSGEGTIRGNLTTAKLNFIMNDNVTGRFIWEHLEPGSYYYSGADNYNWFQFEMIISL